MSLDINPVAFTIFGLEVRWYGILIALGVLLAVFFAEKLAKRTGYKYGLYESIATDLSIVVMICGVIGARLYYVIFQWDYYRENLKEIMAIRNGGLAIYGGIIFGAIAVYFFARRKNIRFVVLADIIAPGLALAQSIGRWGNFVNGEAHGGPTNLPWAIIVDGVKVHPTFLYESILNFFLFLFLYFYKSKRQKFHGELISIYLIVYGIGRFFIEAMRTDSLYIGSFRVSQIVSVIILVIGITLYNYGRKNEKI